MEWYGEYQTTLRRALKEIDPNYEKYNALVVAGTHNPKDYDIEKIIEKIKEAKETKRPTLLICWGYQLGAILWARDNGYPDATSEEWSTSGTFVVKKRESLQVGLKNGESYWNNYEVVIDWEIPEYFFATQAHPEYNSSIDNPHPLLTKFLNYAKMAV